MKWVTEVEAHPNLRGRRIDLSWQNPAAEAFAGAPPFDRIHIVRRLQTFPGGPNDGDVIYSGPVLSSFSDTELSPLETYYYKVFTRDALSEPFAGPESKACAFATESYGLSEKLYRLLPAVHQRYDAPLGAQALHQLQAQFPEAFERLQDLPPEQRSWGQLRRLFLSIGAPFDLLRSFAEGLPQLHDVDRARHDLLPLLGNWLGWDLDGTLPEYAQRNEIRFAPQRYPRVGTLTSLADFVHRYTGWVTQFAEMHECIARTHQAPALNIFSIQENAAGWFSTDDASNLLGFAVGNDSASGALGVSASLTGTIVEPFALRPNTEIAITTDNMVPKVTRFRPGDFSDMATATAAEVASAINATQSQLTAIARVDGRVVLTSNSPGDDSALRVEHAASALVSLEAAPRGRLSPLIYVDDLGEERVRLFYEASEPMTAVQDWATKQTLRGIPRPIHPSLDEQPIHHDPTSVLEVPPHPRRRLSFKTYRAGVWGDSIEVPRPGGMAQGDPATAVIPGSGGGVFLAWIEHPNTPKSRVRFMTGAPQSATPAQLISRNAQPFSITPRSQLVIYGQPEQPEHFHFVPSDFADPANASIAEVTTALTNRLPLFPADALPNNTLRLQSALSGGDQHLVIDLDRSTAAPALGFDRSNHRAQGDWGEDIDWSAPSDVTSLPPGRYSDLHILIDSTNAIWLFCCRHENFNWEIIATRFTGWVWAAPGLTGGAWSAIDSIAANRYGNREPFAILDAASRIWLFWSRKTGVTAADHLWTLRRKMFDPMTLTWGPELALTVPPAGARVADREPSAVRRAAGDFWITFKSNRNGSSDLWALTFDPVAAVVTVAPTAIRTGLSGDHNPIPVEMPNNQLWVLYRSDRSVPLTHAATRSNPAFENRFTFPVDSVENSLRLVDHSVATRDTGTARQFAGTTTVSLLDHARLVRGRTQAWDNVMSYTPQKPVGGHKEAPLQADEPYTRGTIRLFISGLTPLSELTLEKIDRARSILMRFVPINVRLLFELAPRDDIEYVYRDPATGRDIEERYLDRYPFIERFGGITDDFIDALPDWILLRSNTLGHVAGNPADPATLRLRIFSPLLRP